MIKNFFLAVFLFLVVVSVAPVASAQKAVGVLLGSPTSLLGQFELSQGRTLEAGLSLNFENHNYFLLDHLYEKQNLFSQFPSVNLLYGVGGIVAISNKDKSSHNGLINKNSGGLGFGLRVPFNFEWRPQTLSQFGFGLQLVPTISIAPETQASIYGGLSLRYYF